MKVVCAWCQPPGRAAKPGEKETQNDAVSHGICDDHARVLLAEARRAQARANGSPGAAKGASSSLSDP